MAADPNGVEQVVSRTLRDNLEKIQRTADELHQAVGDMVSACASSRPSNALPPMIRVQTCAASLSATLEVLSRFVTGALQSSNRPSYEPETLRMPSMNPPMTTAPFEQPEQVPVHLTKEIPWTLPPPPGKLPGVSQSFTADDVAASPQFPSAVEMPPIAEFSPNMEPVFLGEPVQVFVREPVPHAGTPAAPLIPPANEPVEAGPSFSLDSLPAQEQELHRRAYRVAKVSMQDIKMLRPEDVRAGRENRDLCIRLRDDIEKAHKEYDRRFQSIQSHPVDYFYDWMVEILAGGDPQALGEYPYPSAAQHR